MKKIRDHEVKFDSRCFVLYHTDTKLLKKMTYLQLEKRKSIVHQFEKKALENAWVLPVTYTDRVIALNSKVKGYVIANSHILNNTWRGVYLD